MSHGFHKTLGPKWNKSGRSLPGPSQLPFYLDESILLETDNSNERRGGLLGTEFYHVQVKGRKKKGRKQEGEKEGGREGRKND